MPSRVAKPIKSNPQLDTCRYCSLICRTCFACEKMCFNLGLPVTRRRECEWWIIARVEEKCDESRKTELTSVKCHILDPWWIPSLTRCSWACSKCSPTPPLPDYTDGLLPSHQGPFWNIFHSLIKHEKFSGWHFIFTSDGRFRGENKKLFTKGIIYLASTKSMTDTPK